MSDLAAGAVGAAAYGLWPRLGRYKEEAERERRVLGDDPELVDLVRMASLAASGHNTQPWKFGLAENRIRILPDVTRRTSVVDPDDHHLFVSLGCAAENLVIAARARGRPCEVQIEGEAEPLIDIALGRSAPKDDPLYAAIPLRQTTRSVYDGRPVSSGALALLEAAARQEGVSVRFFTGPADREAILDFVIEGNSAQVDDPAFVAELLAWIRFSAGEALARRDGLFAACAGSPVVPEWVGGLLFKTFFTRDAENAKYADHIRSSAGIAVFQAENADPASWMKVGRSFQRFALQATALGIRTAHVNQPVEVPAIRARFAAWLGSPDTRPDLLVRFGHAPAMPMSLRRPVAEVVV